MFTDPSGLFYSPMRPLDDFMMSSSYGDPGLNLSNLSINYVTDKFLNNYTDYSNYQVASNYTPVNSGYKVSVMVNNNGLFGTHAGLITNNGRVQTIWDPNGSFSYSGWSEGSGREFEAYTRIEQTKMLSSYIQYQFDDGKDVNLYHFNVTPQDYNQIMQRIDNGCGGMLSCAKCTSYAISGIGPFKTVPSEIFLPRTLNNHMKGLKNGN